VNGFLSVAAGAFAAHALKRVLTPDMLDVFQTGAKYQMYHALALVLLGLFLQARPSGLGDVAGYAFTTGIVLFSGSLYALSLSGVRLLGAITPFGGVAFLTGWVCFALAAWRAP
jgi:uncharacterized membrane protein YgdD (TMEM256/DUF423 family)